MEKEKVLAAAKELNETDLAKFKVKVVGVGNNELFKQFLLAVESIPKEKEDACPDSIGDVFNEMRAEEDAGTLNVRPNKKGEPNPEGEAATKEEAKADKKKDKKKGDKASAEKKASNLPAKEKNAYGHVLGSMKATIDAALEKGTTKEAAVKLVIEKHGKDEKVAIKKFDKCVKRLKAAGTAVSYDEKSKKYKIGG
jgi:ribosomal protein L21